MPNERLRLHLEGQSLGDCRLLRRISAGGMAEVYLAEWSLEEQEEQQNQNIAADWEQDGAIVPQALVALKVVCPTNEVTQRSGLVDIAERFTQEGDLLKQLCHPHILPVYRSGVEGDFLYYVMEYVPNGSLADALYGRTEQKLDLPLPLPEALSIITQVGSALHHIHKQGIVHRDVKPGNLLGCMDDQGHWQVLLADFGVAQHMAGAVQPSEQITGTVAYMAPEEFSGHYSPASDQYSLAIVAYQLLTAHLPFEGTLDEQITGHLEVIAPSVRLYQESIPWQVEEVIARALEKQPEDRYPSVAAFTTALASALHEAESGEHAVVAPERLVQARVAHLARQKAQRSTRRRLSYRTRTQMALAIAVALLLATFIAMASFPGGLAHSLAFNGKPNAPLNGSTHTGPAAGGTATQSAGAAATTTPSTSSTTPTSTPTTPTPAPRQTDSASLVALSGPTQVPVSHLFSFTVTLTNTGTSTWVDTQGYQLTCDLQRHPVQNCPAGFAASMGNYAVAPGANVTFSITLTALPAPGVYNAWMNMAHSSAPFKSNDILIQVYTQPASHSSATPTAQPAPTITPTPTPSATPTTTASPTPTIASAAAAGALLPLLPLLLFALPKRKRHAWAKSEIWSSGTAPLLHRSRPRA